MAPLQDEAAFQELVATRERLDNALAALAAAEASPLGDPLEDGGGGGGDDKALDGVSLESRVARIQADLRAHAVNLETLRLQAEDEPVPEVSSRLLDLVIKEERLLKSLQLKFRQSVLVAKGNRDRALIRERDQLLSGGRARKNRTVHESGRELTESLRQTVQMMSSEVERSAASVKALDDSTSMLASTRSQYTTFQSVMKTSTGLLSQLNRQTILDRVFLYGGLLIFLATVAYILWRRMWFIRVDLLIMRIVRAFAPPDVTPLSAASSLSPEAMGTPTATPVASETWLRDEL
ncbi:Protein transport protein sec20 [Cladochytrium tenue]|nr:Protein transport protein sec20 [Cladochytrium tenue]